MKTQMCEKWVDERVGVWTIFGQSADGTRSDVSDGRGDVFPDLPTDLAEKVVTAHDKFREELYAILCR